MTSIHNLPLLNKKICLYYYLYLQLILSILKNIIFYLSYINLLNIFFYNYCSLTISFLYIFFKFKLLKKIFLL
ncbi:unknown [Fusobacterium nucleatum subsp. nucleatum ATCC 25586]|uniref:Uncharacterized protein n=1 Tax=Fusobacterium nucleatum subsp. nucleatum (strain ATCC 25586 / DSM 15643 / BCRC 10681 / CIP 101130 / JCM 8532 / KCTC 2640 / LMG 13131 / VPI 4355) TaxID=190304 RepID=Q8RFV9_FUSNN|nr:unknown [Fusobacterium nucleatum subsp. nucleatum ATCC 25586]